MVFTEDRDGVRDAIAEGGGRREEAEKISVVELEEHAS